MSNVVSDTREVGLVELLDRVLDHGVILVGDITISVAEV
ncbi:gas vesicle protein GvpJ, partial [Sphaerobacter thermophilus]